MLFLPCREMASEIILTNKGKNKHPTHGHYKDDEAIFVSSPRVLNTKGKNSGEHIDDTKNGTAVTQ